jgi:hypothetical protein
MLGAHVGTTAAGARGVGDCIEGEPTTGRRVARGRGGKYRCATVAACPLDSGDGDCVTHEWGSRTRRLARRRSKRSPFRYSIPLDSSGTVTF